MMNSILERRREEVAYSTKKEYFKNLIERKQSVQEIVGKTKIQVGQNTKKVVHLEK